MFLNVTLRLVSTVAACWAQYVAVAIARGCHCVAVVGRQGRSCCVSASFRSSFSLSAIWRTWTTTCRRWRAFRRSSRPVGSQATPWKVHTPAPCYLLITCARSLTYCIECTPHILRCLYIIPKRYSDAAQLYNSLAISVLIEVTGVISVLIEVTGVISVLIEVTGWFQLWLR